MDNLSLLPLIYNAALLLVMLFIYSLFPLGGNLKTLGLKSIATGFGLGVIGMLIMLSPWQLSPGVVFDSRSVLLAVTGLYFGIVPTIIAVLMTAALRLVEGGLGVWVGIGVIFSSGAIGLLWRHKRGSSLEQISWLELYLFGLLVHLTMLALMFFLPWDIAIEVLAKISWPILLIYPVMVTLLGAFLSNNLRLQQSSIALQKSEFLFHSQFDLGNIGIAITSTDKGWLRTNAHLCQMLGYSEEELMKMGWDELSHPDDLAADLEQFERMLSGEIDAYELDKRFICKDGNTLYVHLTLACYKSEGKIDFFIATLLDMTERKQAEAALQRSEERLKTMFNQAPLGIALIDSLTGDIHKVNPMFAKIVGRTVEQMANIDWLRITHPDDVQEDLDNMALLNAGKIAGFQMEKRYIYPDGTVVWVNMTVAPQKVENNAPPEHLCMIEDITERKNSAIERDKLMVSLETKNTDMERFTYAVSHDLKSPLVTIKGFIGYLEKDASEGNQKRLSNDIKHINKAANIMGTLLDELLEFSRVGRLDTPYEKISMFELVDETVELLSGRIIEGKVKVNIQPDFPTAFGERPRIREVMQNLIENAVKFMGEQPAPHVEIGSDERNGEVVYYVRDNGVGIDKVCLGKIFGMFERLDTAIDGTGMGLALVNRIIETHGGRIWVESEGKGMGSMFCFTLPQKEKGPSHQI